MKFAIALLSIVLGGSTLSTERKPAQILSVELEADRKVVVVHFSVESQKLTQKFTFDGPVEDFHYCRWLGESGVALVARVGSGEQSSYYMANDYFTDASRVMKASRIEVPKQEFPVLGIGNTGSDSVVISALTHDRKNGSNQLSGWVFVSNCPIPEMSPALGILTLIPTLSVEPARQPESPRK